MSLIKIIIDYIVIMLKNDFYNKTLSMKKLKLCYYIVDIYI